MVMSRSRAETWTRCPGFQESRAAKSAEYKSEQPSKHDSDGEPTDFLDQWQLTDASTASHPELFRKGRNHIG
jgi:hypothetical protein